MNDENVRGVHWSFWTIGVVALIRNVMSVINFFWQMNADALAAMPESHRVLDGALGCLLLLLRKSAAYYLFIASLLGVIVTMTHTLDIASSTIDFSPFEILMMILLPLAGAAFLICKELESILMVT